MGEWLARLEKDSDRVGMAQDGAKRWQACLQFIEDNIGERSFSTWFAPAVFQGYENGVLEVLVPSSFFIEYWESHFVNELRSALGKNFPAGTRLKYAYRLGDEMPKTELSDMTERARGRVGAYNPQKSVGDVGELDADLDPRCTFENFLEGPSNKYPRSIALAIAEHFQDAFNPFFIYGHSGVGKTHLANAIGNKVKELSPEKRVLYVSAHYFLQQYTQSVRDNHFNEFMAFYLSIDVLIIDDIQEISGKRSTQEAFFNVFNHLQRNRKQLILTCDRPPSLLEGIQERLITRFSWGLIAELERPDASLRRRFILNRVEKNSLPFPADVVNYIASHVQDSIREIEGVLNSILAFSVVNEQDINLDLAEKTIGRTVRLNQAPVTTERVLECVGRHFRIGTKEILSATRKKDIAQARQIVMYLAQKYTKLSSTQIGQRIGRRDHSTVLHSIGNVERRLSVDKEFRMEVEEIERAILK